VKVFLDTSVLLSASGSGKGASRYIVKNAQAEKWELVSSHYCREETVRNLNKLGVDAEHYFAEALDGNVAWKTDTVSSDKIVIFPKAKDRPVVLSALAENCDVLLTLDRADFHGKLGDQFYAILIRTPGDWLLELRDQGLI
jgi:predicted nucleic acid-binding protein